MNEIDFWRDAVKTSIKEVEEDIDYVDHIDDVEVLVDINELLKQVYEFLLFVYEE